MQMFVSKSALTLHLEGGACPSGIDRRIVNRQIVALDKTSMIANSSRLLTYDDSVQYGATDRAWNGYAFECYLCHAQMRTLVALNQHLRSPRHDQKIYQCPNLNCGLQVTTLSALCQHIESGKCGIARFKQVQDAMDSIFNGMKRLAL